MNNLMRLFLSPGKFIVKHWSLAAWTNEQNVCVCVNMWASACLCVLWTVEPTYMLLCMIFLSLCANRVACKYVLWSHHGQLCSFLFAFFWVHGPSFVCNPMCVGGIVKCKNCISSGIKASCQPESRRAEGVVWKCMYTCCLLQPPTLPLLWLPTSKHLDPGMKWPGHGSGQQSSEDRNQWCCQKPNAAKRL